MSTDPKVDPAERSSDGDSAGRDPNTLSKPQHEVLNRDQLAEAKRYARDGLYCELADKALDVAFLAVMSLILAFPINQWLRDQVGLTNTPLRLGAMILIVTGIHICVSFPLSFYSGHVLEHKYSMSNQTFWQWLWRYAKTQLLAIIFGLLLFEGLYLVIFVTGSLWWLAAAVAFFLVSVVLGQLAPVLIFPLFYKIEKLSDQQLTERFTQLCDGTGLTIEGVYRMDMSAETVKANAALVGLGKTRRVILGDTLLESFTPDEIAVVFAHEVGHHVHRHLRIMLVIGALMSLAGFLVCHGVIRTWTGDPAWTSDLPVYVLPMFMLIITVFSLLLEPFQNSISRQFERQSDRYALQSTGLVDAYRSAFTKLARLNKDDPHPHPLEVFLLYSHPSIAERLALADEVSSA